MVPSGAGFRLADLALVNWLTLITEYIGMIEAMKLFGIPGWFTFVVRHLILCTVILSGSYWNFEKLTLFFCAFNLVYIPGGLLGDEALLCARDGERC